jgi:hypothetical protein
VQSVTLPLELERRPAKDVDDVLRVVGARHRHADFCHRFLSPCPPLLAGKMKGRKVAQSQEVGLVRC